MHDFVLIIGLFTADNRISVKNVLTKKKKKMKYTVLSTNFFPTPNFTLFYNKEL